MDAVAAEGFACFGSEKQGGIFGVAAGVGAGDGEMAARAVKTVFQREGIEGWGVGFCAMVWKRIVVDSAFSCVGAGSLVDEDG